MSNKSINIKVIVDNSAAEGFVAEHGYSVFIDNGSDKVIFDCGQNEAFTYNVSRAGIELDQITKLVISHGHYDHTGAVKDVLSAVTNIRLYAHPNIFITRYSLHEGCEPRDISIRENQRKLLNDLPKNQVQLSTSSLQVSERIYLTGEISRVNDFEDAGGPFFLDTEKRVADLLSDDQSLCIKTDKGIVIITGCCHSGIVNTMEHVKSHFSQSIYMVIGGLHLVNAPNERIEKTIDAFRQFGIDKIIPCHCTGDNAIKLMQSELGDIVVPGYAGMEIEL